MIHFSIYIKNHLRTHVVKQTSGCNVNALGRRLTSWSNMVSHEVFLPQCCQPREVDLLNEFIRTLLFGLAIWSFAWLYTITFYIANTNCLPAWILWMGNNLCLVTLSAVTINLVSYCNHFNSSILVTVLIYGLTSGQSATAIHSSLSEGTIHTCKLNILCIHN